MFEGKVKSMSPDIVTPVRSSVVSVEVLMSSMNSYESLSAVDDSPASVLVFVGL